MEEKKRGGIRIAAMMAAVLTLFISVKFIFGLMEEVMPNQWSAQVWDNMYNEKGNTSPYHLRMLKEEEFTYADLKGWMKAAQESEEDQVFWLYRQEQEEYVLYLPQQDRKLENRDLSATEEVMPDGRVTLVLRARTPEESESVVPEEHLFCVKSESTEWDGQRVRVILDGRNQNVVKMNAVGPNVYNEDGMKVS